MLYLWWWFKWSPRETGMEDFCGTKANSCKVDTHNNVSNKYNYQNKINVYAIVSMTTPKR